MKHTTEDLDRAIRIYEIEALKNDEKDGSGYIDRMLANFLREYKREKEERKHEED